MYIIKLKRKCPICGNNEGEKIYHVSMKVPEDFPITGKYDVVCCSKCGFIYADINDTQGAITNIILITTCIALYQK